MTVNAGESNTAHQHSDVDSGALAQHHTLGTRPHQAAPGNHKHKPHAYKRKSTTTGKVSATYAIDTDFNFEIKKDHTYVVLYRLAARNPTSDTPDLKTRLSWTGTAEVDTYYNAPVVVNTGTANVTTVGMHADPAITASPTTSRAWGLSSEWLTIQIEALVTCSADGVLSLEWAQNATDAANPSQLAEGCFVTAWEVV